MSLFRGEGDGSIPLREFISLEVPNNPPTGSGAGYWMFVADHNYNVTNIREIHKVAGGSGYTLAVRKIQTDGIAPNAAAGANVIELLSTPMLLTTTVNTVQTAAPSVTTLAKGDRVAFVFAGTETGYVGSIQVELQAA